MKRLLSIWLLLLPIIAMAQLKHDANWVFGERCGVKFDNYTLPSIFPSINNNNEASASISNKEGDLLLYLSCPANYLGQIKNGNNNLIVDGDNVNVYYSATNGAVFLPVSNDSILLFHTGLDPNCGMVRCLRLYYSLIVKSGLNNWEVAAKNILLMPSPVEEAIALVKHSNGKDWWLYIHEERVNQPDSCSNKYYYFKLQGSLIFGPFEQQVLGNHCGSLSSSGEVSVSSSGQTMMNRAVNSDGNIYMYIVNRCNGVLDLRSEIDTDIYSYSIANSGSYMYVGIENLGSGAIYQYNLDAVDIVASKRTIYSNSTNLVGIGQMETINGDVVVNFYYLGNDSILKRKFQRHLSIIEFSKTDSARIRHEYIYLGDSAKTSYGLPNFPNYNLGPEGVFLANAGKDTVLCSNTNSTGATIGSPPVPNVTYLWQPNTGLSASTVAQPTANPIQSTWYYLTATDTTATSCAVNTDSVYIEVRTCTGITETQTLQARLYPNPAAGTFTIELPTGQSGNIELYNLLGQNVFNASINGTTILQMELPKGVYIYRINSGGKTLNGKLIIE